MHACVVRRLQVEDRHANIAAQRDLPPRLPQDMGDQRRRGRLAVGAGDRDERRFRGAGGALAGEEFDVADHRDARLVGALHRPVRLGMRQGHARARERAGGSRASLLPQGPQAGSRPQRLAREPADCRPRRRFRRHQRGAPRASTGPTRRGRRRRLSVRGGSRPASHVTSTSARRGRPSRARRR